MWWNQEKITISSLLLYLFRFLVNGIFTGGIYSLCHKNLFYLKPQHTAKVFFSEKTVQTLSSCILNVQIRLTWKIWSKCKKKQKKKWVVVQRTQNCSNNYSKPRQTMKNSRCKNSSFNLKREKHTYTQIPFSKVNGIFSPWRSHQKQKPNTKRAKKRSIVQMKDSIQRWSIKSKLNYGLFGRLYLTLVWNSVFLRNKIENFRLPFGIFFSLFQISLSSFSHLPPASLFQWYIIMKGVWVAW